MGRTRTKNKKSKVKGNKNRGNTLVFSGVLMLLASFVLPRMNFPVQSIELPQSDISVSAIDNSLDNEPIEIDEKLLTQKNEKGSHPTRVLVPSLGIDVELKDAKVVSGRWEVFETTGSYGLGSAIPGSTGNTVVFAHARDKLFLPLKQIKENTVVYILTQDKWYTYEAREIKEVLPNDVSVVAPTEDETLTLYTCSGFADSKRLIVTAKRAS
jgi:LPXTG-site transpeptidase (sortase) family protein